MSWAGAFLGLGIALGLTGLALTVGILAELQRRDRVPEDNGTLGIAAILFVIGAVLVGAVLGV